MRAKLTNWLVTDTRGDPRKLVLVANKNIIMNDPQHGAWLFELDFLKRRAPNYYRPDPEIGQTVGEKERKKKESSNPLLLDGAVVEDGQFLDFVFIREDQPKGICAIFDQIKYTCP